MILLYMYCAFAYGFLAAVLLDLLDDFESDNQSDSSKEVCFVWLGAFICWVFAPIVVPVCWVYNSIQAIKQRKENMC